MPTKANRFTMEARSFKLAFPDASPMNIAEINEEILDSVRKHGIKAILAYTQEGRSVTFEELAINGLPDGAEGDVLAMERDLTFDFEDHKLFVLGMHSASPISRLKLTVLYTSTSVPETPEAMETSKPTEAVVMDYISHVCVQAKE